MCYSDTQWSIIIIQWKKALSPIQLYKDSAFFLSTDVILPQPHSMQVWLSAGLAPDPLIMRWGLCVLQQVSSGLICSTHNPGYVFRIKGKLLMACVFVILLRCIFHGFGLCKYKFFALLTWLLISDFLIMAWMSVISNTVTKMCMETTLSYVWVVGCVKLQWDSQAVWKTGNVHCTSNCKLFWRIRRTPYETVQQMKCN